MKRILVFGMTENAGGVERFLRNYYLHFDRSLLQMDFLCNSYNDVAYEEELRALGARFFHFTARSKNIVRYRKELNRFFRLHASEYDTIWVNVSSLANIDYLKLAKKYGIRRRIIHSHNSRNMDSDLRGLLHAANRKIIGQYATDFWACSDEASKWFYSEALRSEARIVKNALDLQEMAFSQEGRMAVRTRLGIGNAYLIGNVGRFHFQKNQEWVLKVFAELRREMPDARLLLIGQGEDEDKLHHLAAELDITDDVIFGGQVDRMADWLSAMDLFLFPSYFEGLPYSLLEAQANGLPVLASDGAVTSDSRISPVCRRLSLQRSTREWAMAAAWMRKHDERIRQDILQDRFSDSGYNILPEAQRLQEIMLKGN